MNTGKHIINSLIVVLTFFLSGCATMGTRLEPPKISMVDIRPIEMKALESVLQLELRVFNTNDIPVTIKGLDCELDVNGRRFALGVSNDEVNIPSFGTETVSILVYSSVLDIFRGVIGLRGKEELKYQLTGKVRLYADSLSPVTVPFTSEGELSLKNESY